MKPKRGFLQRIFSSTEHVEDKRINTLNFAQRERRVNDKEQEYARLEKMRAGELARQEKLELKIKELSTYRDGLAEEIKTKKSELSSAQSELKNTLHTIRDEEKKLLLRVKELKEVEAELLQKESLLDTKQQLLGRKESELTTREDSIRLGEDTLNKNQNAFEKRRISLEKTVSKLASDKMALEKEISLSEV